MKRETLTLLIALPIIFLSACKKHPRNDDDIPLPDRVKAAPDGFTFTTSKKIDVNIRLLTNTNVALKNVVVKVLQPGKTEADGLFLKMVSDANGFVKGSVTVPSYLDTLMVQPDYPGLNNRVKVLISQNTLSGTIGGSDGYSGNVVPETLAKGPAPDPSRVLTIDLLTGIDFSYPTGYTTTSSAVKTPVSLGVPKYLETVRDVITQTTLDNLLATYPEGSTNNVATRHPELLTSTVTSLNVTQTGYLFVTFISEGSSVTNTLGYYTYPTNNPPTTIGDINNVTLVFPNASASGSLGGLVAGDKVKIGPFSAGTSVGFVLMQDAWTGSGVYVSGPKFFTTPALNPETTSTLKRHSVLVYDSSISSFVLGFEDLNRQSFLSNPGLAASDNDFNDLMLYISPSSSVSTTGVSSVSQLTDQDGDGIYDASDEFPADAARAYTETSSWNTLAFEDLWPNTGDYDMNDLVIQYRYRYVRNAGGSVVEFYGDYKVQAAGAIYNDGFGVEFPFAASLVKTVTGQRLSSNYITQAASGLEAGHTNAVIIPFDDYHSVIANSSNSSPFINTDMNFPKVEGELLSIKVEFNAPQSASLMGSAPYNPFLISNKQRGYEVHLPGNAPTAKGDKGLLGTGNDRSNVSTGKYYQTANNWPWAINICGTFQHPTEGSAINLAYLHFLDWAQSGGNQYEDWWTSTASGYRNSTKIYTK